MTAYKGLIFVGGNPRSGTSALVKLLNAHPDLWIGMERYFNLFRDGTLDRAHFDLERFVDMQAGDTHAIASGQLGNADKIRRRFERARMVGDKYPNLGAVLDHIAARFEGAKLLFILRNPVSVAESYQERFRKGTFTRDHKGAIEDWNRNNRGALAYLRAGGKLTVVSYERAFRGRRTVSAIYEALGLDPDTANKTMVERVLAEARALEGKIGPRNETIRRDVALGADFDTYRELVERHCILNNLPAAPQPSVAEGVRE